MGVQKAAESHSLNNTRSNEFRVWLCPLIFVVDLKEFHEPMSARKIIAKSARSALGWRLRRGCSLDLSQKSKEANGLLKPCFKHMPTLMSAKTEYQFSSNASQIYENAKDLLKPARKRLLSDYLALDLSRLHGANVKVSVQSYKQFTITF